MEGMPPSQRSLIGWQGEGAVLKPLGCNASFSSVVRRQDVIALRMT